MDGRRVPPAPKRRARSRELKEEAAFLAVRERDGHWHIVGTVKTDLCSRRVRTSTGLPATSQYLDLAKDRAWEIESDIIQEIVSGIVTCAVGSAVSEYLEIGEDGGLIPGGRGDELGGSDRRVLVDVIGKFGERSLKDIGPAEWQAFVNRRQAGNSLDTKRRYISPIKTFLAWCAASDRAYLAEAPVIVVRDGSQPRQRGKSQRKRDRARVAELSAEILAFVFDHAHISLRAQLYTEWSTGARLSSVLFGCAIADLVIGQKGSFIKFHDTKNGDDVTADLHPVSVQVLMEYLEWRGSLHRRHEPLFLTYRRKPYSALGRKRGWSGQNKTAFNAMKRRAISSLRTEAADEARRLRAAGDRGAAWSVIIAARKRSDLIRKLTQHWLRHWFATHALALGMPEASVMHQGGWRDRRSMANYQHDVPDVRRQVLEQMPIGTNVTRGVTSKRQAIKKKGKS